MRVVATYSIKGGVGKTTTAVNLAAEAASRGWRVLLWDLDPQGGATYLFRVAAKVKGGAKGIVQGRRTLDEVVRGTDIPNLDLVPADFRNRYFDVLLNALKQPTAALGAAVEPLADTYDWVVLDCAPGASLVGEGVLAAADALLVPIVPSMLSVRTLDQLLDFIDDRPDSPAPPALFGFLSMVDFHRRAHRELAEELPKERPEVVLPVVVRNTSLVEQMGQRRAPIRSFAPGSAASRAYAELWSHVEARWPEP